MDGLFVALLLHFFITGHVVPSVVVELFREEPQFVASVEPEAAPGQSPEIAPLNEDGENSPETRARGLTFGAV